MIHIGYLIEPEEQPAVLDKIHISKNNKNSKLKVKNYEFLNEIDVYIEANLLKSSA